MKKLVFILLFFFIISYKGNVLGAQTNETFIEQEEALGISGFIKEAESYTKETFSNIDLNSIYENAISGKIDTNGIFNAILKITGKEVVNTIKILGYILVIVIIHSIIKSVSEGIGNRRNRRNHILCSIYTNCYLNYDEFFRNNSFDKRYSE